MEDPDENGIRKISTSITWHTRKSESQRPEVKCIYDRVKERKSRKGGSEGERGGAVSRWPKPDRYASPVARNPTISKTCFSPLF